MKKRFSICVGLLMIIGSVLGTVAALDPLDSSDAEADPDQDGLSNAEEYVYATDPNNPDTDGGGTYDGWEVWYENHRAVRDVNTGETIISDDYHFDPNYAGDEGVFDFFGNIKDSVQRRDADASVTLNDPDNDGWNNLHEALFGTDPTNPNTDGDCNDLDSTDPDPLVSDCTINDIEDDHPSGNGGGGSGNGGGGSGEGHGLAAEEG